MSSEVEISSQPTISLDIEESDDQIFVEISQESQTTVEISMASGPIGPQGPIGPPGLSDRMFFVRIAAENIGGHRAVMGNLDGTISVASSSNTGHLGKVLGITIGAVVEGEETEVIRSGIIEFEGWDWNLDNPIYLSVNGLLSQTPATTGFSQIVGFAETPTKLFVNLREPILL
jgi:hypothetical protein